MEPMEIDRKELKRLARESMKLTQPGFRLVTLVYFLMTTVVINLADLIPFSTDPVTGLSTPLIFIIILLALYTTVVDFGYTLWSLWTFRRLDPGLNSLIQGFSVAGRVLLLNISIYFRLVGWVLVFSMLLALSMMFLMGLPLLAIPLVVAFYAAIFAVSLRYSLAPYLLADRPDDGTGLAIHRSIELMRGWKWELFKLEFSFFGWDLINIALSVLVLIPFLANSDFFSLLMSGNAASLESILYSVTATPLYLLVSNLVVLPLFLWLQPYRSVTVAGFYDARLRLYRANTPEPPPL